MATIAALAALVSTLGLHPAFADAVPFLPISELEGNEFAPAIAYNSNRDEYLVVWHDVYEVVHARRVSSNGQLLNSFDVSTSPNGRRQASVAYDPVRDRYLVAWVNSAPAEPTYISGRRIFADGTGFPPGDGFTISSGTDDRDFPDLACNPARNEYLATWQMDTAGGGEFAIAGWPDNEHLPAVAACETADQYLVAWQSDQGTGGSDWAICGRFVRGAGVPGTVPLIVDTTLAQTAVDMSCDASGQQYLLAWEDVYVGGKSGIWARVVHPDETMEPDFVIDQPGGNFDRTEPAAGLAAMTAVATLDALFRSKRSGKPRVEMG